ncbi:MAG TPA: PAS domain-containing protein [Pyrinomonadaceae bacterium]|jgi:PAS domain S-box-containing protein|nr:PAS domain-containing protein [Pyrinomonadaceae bacterium]
MTHTIESELIDTAVGQGQILFTLDLAGNFKSLDSLTERIFGYSAGELSRMNLAHLVPPQHADYVRSQIARAVDAGLGAVYEVEICAKDGRRLALEISTRLIMRDGCPFELEAIGFLRADSWSTQARCLHEEVWIDCGLTGARALTFI